MKQIILKRGKEVNLQRRHPWIFSGAIYNLDKDIQSGDPVQVLDSRDHVLAVGHYQDASIAVRILAFEDVALDATFWKGRVAHAYELREMLDLTDSKSTNCYRLINAEGDGLSGLIVDIYGDTAVIQCHSHGMYKSIDLISQAIQDVYGDKIKTIYDKNKISNQIEKVFLKGKESSGIVLENGLKFNVDWVVGQKTGFFLDQRENRNLLRRYSKGKNVLNAFCYTGGFSVYAQDADAAKIDSVDVSTSAIELTKANMDLNAKKNLKVVRNEIVADVMKYLKESKEKYNVMIIDPPAFAKSQRKRHNAVQGYKRLNAQAIRKIEKGGIIFTFSCSQVVDRPLFIDTIRAAAIEAERNVQFLHHLSQPSDHPTNACHPEGAYLKGLVLRVF